MDSPIGWIRVSGDDSFISEITFIDEPATRDQPGKLPVHMELCRNELHAYFNGTLQNFSFPASQEGTDFQKRIWKELLHVPYGETWSYAQLAKKSGDPKNSRAVGNANGKNNIAIAIPCHRIIGQDGSLTGYAGGLWRKEWLLNHEAKVAHGVLELF